MGPEIEVFDDVMHVSRNRSFSLKKSLKKASCLLTALHPIFLPYFYLTSVYSFLVLNGCENLLIP